MIGFDWWHGIPLGEYRIATLAMGIGMEGGANLAARLFKLLINLTHVRIS